MENELVPYIESHYSTDTVKTIVGQSLGGLFATEILFEKPEMFTNYLIVSPSLWWDNESLLKRKSVLMDSSNQQQKNIFIAVGNEGVQMENDAKALTNLFENDGNHKLIVKFELLAMRITQVFFTKQFTMDLKR